MIVNISTDGTNTSSNIVYVNKPLCSIENTRAELDYTNKKTTISCIKRIYNGDEEWHYESKIGTYHAFNLATYEAKTNGKIISSHFKYEEGSADTEHIRLDGSSPYARIKLYCKFATEDELKTWLAANPLEVVYELANPIIEDIDCSDKIVQYDETTNVYNTDGAEIEISLNNSEAISDINQSTSMLREEIIELKKQITDLTAMVISV